MARRGTRGIAAFFEGFNQAYDTAGRVMTDIELAKIAKETPTTTEGYTADDGQQLRAMADAKDADGKPYYLVGTDANGAYQVTPQFNVNGQQAQPITLAKKGVTDFMGQRTVGTMAPEQVNNARMRAMAGVIAKTDPVRGMQMMNDVTRGEREDQRFTWERNRADREQRKADQEESGAETLRQVDAQSAEWLTNRLKNPDGTARTAGVDDYLAASQFRANALAQAGKMDAAAAAMKDYNAQSLVKIQLETASRDQAIARTAAAVSAGDMNAARDFYNQFVPDGGRVTNVSRGANGQITIERETMDGRPMPPTLMKDAGQLLSTLSAFKDPMALYNWSQGEFKNNLLIKQDARDEKKLGLEGARVGLAQAADRRAAEDHTATAPDRQAKGEVGKLKIELANLDANTPDGKKREAEIAAKLSALSTGTRSASPHDPADVQKARALVASGTYPDMATALDGIINKPDQAHKAFVESGLKNMLKPADAVKDADETMAAMGWSRSGSRWTKAGGGKEQPAAAAAKPSSEADAHTQAKAAIAKGASKEAVNKRLQELGFKPVN